MSIDPRQERTREALRKGFLRCLEDASFESISITDIARASGIARQTFYLHYSEKDAILHEYLESFLRRERTEFAAAVEDRQGHDARAAIAEVFQRMLTRIQEEAVLFRLVIGGRAGGRLRDRVREHQRYVNQLFLRSQGPVNLPEAELHLVASFCAGGVLDLLERWLSGGMEIPAHRIAELMGELLEGALYRSVTRSSTTKTDDSTP